MFSSIIFAFIGIAFLNANALPTISRIVEDDTIPKANMTMDMINKMVVMTTMDMMNTMGIVNTMDMVTNQTGCNCEGFTCVCCSHLDNKDLNLNVTACLNISILMDAHKAEIKFTLNGNTIYDNIIPIQNPPPMCVYLPYPGSSICVELYSINFLNGKFTGCADFVVNFNGAVVAKKELGCFKMPYHETMNELSPIKDNETIENIIKTIVNNDNDDKNDLMKFLGDQADGHIKIARVIIGPVPTLDMIDNEINDMDKLMFPINLVDMLTNTNRGIPMSMSMHMEMPIEAKKTVVIEKPWETEKVIKMENLMDIQKEPMATEKLMKEKTSMDKMDQDLVKIMQKLIPTNFEKSMITEKPMVTEQPMKMEKSMEVPVTMREMKEKTSMDNLKQEIEKLMKLNFEKPIQIEKPMKMEKPIEIPVMVKDIKENNTSMDKIEQKMEKIKLIKDEIKKLANLLA